MSRPSLNLTQVEVKLYSDDYKTMVKHYGRGWTGEIREMVREHCRMIRSSGIQQTAGDYADD